MIETSIMPFGITNIHISINVSEFISNINFISLREFNRVAK